MRRYRGLDGVRKPLNVRYVGSLVADFHRNLLRGGIFCYPAEGSRRDGKLRLLYEAGPLAFLMEQAGGYASDGRLPILDIVPTHPHQRVALYMGNRSLVERLEAFVRQEDDALAPEE
jgi:fructose-1,6-bisphosphatase I